MIIGCATGAILLLAMSAPQGTPEGAPLANYIGEWVNKDIATRGVAAFKIEKTAYGVRISIDGDNGTPTIFTPGVSVKPHVSTSVLMLSTRARTYLIRAIRTDELQLEMLTQFNDGGARSNYRFASTFTRKKGP
jgi:hypothetical protein